MFSHTTHLQSWSRRGQGGKEEEEKERRGGRGEVKGKIRTLKNGGDDESDDGCDKAKKRDGLQNIRTDSLWKEEEEEEEREEEEMFRSKGKRRTKRFL